MSTDVETVSIADLEEMLDNDIMCGGNNFPRRRPCPEGRKAVVRLTHLCGCRVDIRPQSFKCCDCYSEFVAGFVAKYGHASLLTCPGCRRRFPGPLGRIKYVPL